MERRAQRGRVPARPSCESPRAARTPVCGGRGEELERVDAACRAHGARADARGPVRVPLAEVALDGDALELVPKLHAPFEFVFIDAWKQDYVRYLEMVLPLVPAGGLIVAHNVTDLRDQLQDFIHAVQSNPQLDTRIVNAGPGGFSVSIKRAPRD